MKSESSWIILGFAEENDSWRVSLSLWLLYDSNNHLTHPHDRGSAPCTSCVTSTLCFQVILHCLYGVNLHNLTRARRTSFPSSRDVNLTSATVSSYFPELAHTWRFSRSSRVLHTWQSTPAVTAHLSLCNYNISKKQRCSPQVTELNTLHFLTEIMSMQIVERTECIDTTLSIYIYSRFEWTVTTTPGQNMSL